MPAEEVEPRVLTADVRAAIRGEIRESDEDEGDSVALLAEKARTSTRTIYRVLGLKTETLTLDLADRLLVAAGHHLYEVGLVWPEESVD